MILGTEGGAAGTIVSSTSGTKTNSNAAGRYDLEVNTSITGDQLKAALVIPEGATAKVYTTWDNVAANDPTTEITGALTADGSTVYFVQIVSKDHSTKKVYEFTADVYTAPAEQIPYDTANIETVISTTLATKDAVEITGGALALTGTLTIADGKTLTVKTGGITGNQSVEVTGTLVVEAGGVAGSLDIKAGGTAAVTGAVTTVTDVAATGTATITGTVTTVTDNNGTLNVTGNITTVSDNNGTLTVSGSGYKIVTLANAAKGAITADIDTVENITAAAETVTITGNINTELRNVTSGTLNVSGTVAKVTNITDGTVTINGAVGEVTDITDGTITFKDDVADVKDISGGTVKFEKGATIGGAAVLGTAAIQLTTADSTLTLGTASEVINIAGLTGLTGVANAKVVVASSAVTVAANQLYSAADTAVGAGVVGQTGNYIMNAAGTQFVYTA